MKPETRALVRRILDIQRELDVRKALFDELEMLTLQLQADGFETATLDGFVVDLVDNFAKGNVVFRPAGVKRFEVKVKAVKS